MPHQSRVRSRPSRLLLGAGVLILVLLALLLARGLDEDDEPRSEPAATGSTQLPGAAPSSGPTTVPEPGSLDPVPVGEVITAPPVDLDDEGDFGTGVTLRIVERRAVEGEARGPGEVAGPAVQLVLEARNDSSKAVRLDRMVVDVDYGPERTPAMALTEPGTDPFEGALAPGESIRATYVFGIPEAERGRVRVLASYTGEAPTLVFRGDVR